MYTFEFPVSNCPTCADVGHGSILGVPVLVDFNLAALSGSSRDFDLCL